MRPTCNSAGCTKPVKNNGFRVDGSRKYYTKCSGCRKKIDKQGCETKKRETARKWWAEHGGPKRYGSYEKLPYCEKCGFIAKHRCQLDVDHIDGDHDNNLESNLQTLCSNCHRVSLKNTYGHYCSKRCKKTDKKGDNKYHQI